MSQFIKTGLFQQIKRSPLLQFQRYRVKINIQRPQKLHYERALVTAVTTPRYVGPPKTCFRRRAQGSVATTPRDIEPFKTCFGESAPVTAITTPIYIEHAKRNTSRTRQDIPNPYNDIIAREVRDRLENSKMIAIFHLNSIKSSDFFDAQVKFHKKNMTLKMYGYKIMCKALEDTRYKAILSLFSSKQCIVYSPEQNVSQLLKISRKVPQIILMAGVVDNTLLSRNELISYAQKGNLQSVQAELVHTLNSAANTIVQNLEGHQNNFVNILDVYTKFSASATETAAGNKETEEKNE